MTGMKRRLALFTVVVIIPFLLPPMLLSAPAAGHQVLRPNLQYAPSQWLPGWEYRKSHTITGAIGTGAGYQVQLVVHFGAGTDSGDNVYCNSHSQTDFDDIRFLDDDGVTQLDHWRESYVSSDYAVFWVEVVDILDTDSSIWVYYGNTGATSASNGDSTFLQFDDFDGSLDTTNKWLLVQGSISTNGGYLDVLGTTGTRGNILYRSTLNTDCMMHFRGYANDRDVDLSHMGFKDDAAGEDEAGFMWVDLQDTSNCRAQRDGTSTLHEVNVGVDVTGEHTYSVGWDVGDAVTCRRDNTLIDTITTNVPTSSDPMAMRFSEGIINGENWYVNWAFVRKWSPSGEPGHGTWGAEESLATTTATTTATITGDNTILLLAAGGVGAVAILVVASVILSRRRSERGPPSRIEPDEDSPPPDAEAEKPIPAPPPRVPREVVPAQAVTTPSPDILKAITSAAATPRIIERRPFFRAPKGPVQVASGFDVAGENLKLAVKVSNADDLTISNVQVVLDVPDGFEFVKGTDDSQNLGSIPGGGFQSAIFWLRPKRCVDGEYGGIIIYRDARNKRQTLEIPPKRLVNICPMLTGSESAEEVLSRLKSGNLTRNCASFEFTGGARAVLQMAEARLKGLTSVDQTEKEYEDGTYLGYSCYLGQTKYGEQEFAAEIQVSGTPSGGVLTLSVYSDDERILSGFFVDVMHDVREHVDILEEKTCPVATCSKCGANLDLTKIQQDRVYRCEFCGAMGKVAPWMD